MKFNAVYPKTGRKGKFRREKFVGPCAVEMTEAQIVAFKDILQTAPQTLATEPPPPEPEDPGNGDGNGGDGEPDPDGGDNPDNADE
jgi:hypothetical protein